MPSSTEAETTANDQFTLAGVWKSECLNLSLGLWIIGTMTNTDTESKLDSVFYLSSSCLAPVRKETTLGTYEVVGDVEGIEGAKKVNYTYSTSNAVLLDDATVAEANSNTLYGYSDWAKDIVKDTTGKTAVAGDDALPASGDLGYGIVKIESGTYRGGDPASGDGSSADKRPTSLGNLILTKQ